MMRPFTGVFLYNFNLSLVEVMALYTESLVYFDLIFAAYAYSCAKKLICIPMFSFGGIAKVTMDVPFL